MNSNYLEELLSDIRKNKKIMVTRDIAMPDEIKNKRDLLNVAACLSYDSVIEVLRDKEKAFVWHVAMPKSGSTWVTRIIGDLLEEQGWIKSGTLAIDGISRPQEIVLSEMYRQHLLVDNVFVRHMHALGSAYNIKFIKNINAKVIVQVRNIEDVMVSLIDHFDNEDIMMGPAVYLKKENWKMFSAEQKVEYVINFAAPWFIRFWVSWYSELKELESCKYMFLHYEDLVAVPDLTFNQVLSFCDESLQNIPVAHQTSIATRKNKGIVGRGRTLPEWARLRLKNMTQMYPEVDFSAVGL